MYVIITLLVMMGLYRFYTSFGLLVMMAVIQGMLGHAGLTLNTVVIIDLMGLQHLPKVLGFVCLPTLDGPPSITR